ncbi:hypothetical protein EG832_00375 [bacterium]|nr:hypothetical protein [bacterium]
MSYIVICGGIILLVIVLGIIPLHRYSANRSEDIRNIKDQIQEQKDLRAVYQLLDGNSKKQETLSLPNPPKERLRRTEVSQFQDSFRMEAKKSGLMVVALAPDTKSVAGDSSYLIYSATMKGDFADFRKMLVGLGALPYVDQIQEIGIRQGSDSMEFRIRIGVALAN